MPVSRSLPPRPIPANTIGRLSLYRRLLAELAGADVRQVFSHELAARAVISPAQVRRDLMTIGFSGSPRRGYTVGDLKTALESVLARSVETTAALVGVGNLGRAILAYYRHRLPVRFVAAFDRDPEKAGRTVHDCRCYLMQDLADIVTRAGIHVGVIAVPAREAQGVADRLVLAGVRGILNFAPARLRVPSGLYLENVDMTTALDRVAFYAHDEAAPSAPANTLFNPRSIG